MPGGPVGSGGYAGSSHGGSVPRRSYEERAAAKEQMMQSLRDSSQQERRVYVGNLSYDVKWHHLKDFMRQGTSAVYNRLAPAHIVHRSLLPLVVSSSFGLARVLDRRLLTGQRPQPARSSSPTSSCCLMECRRWAPRRRTWLAFFGLSWSFEVDRWIDGLGPAVGGTIVGMRVSASRPRPYPRSPTWGGSPRAGLSPSVVPCDMKR